LAGIRSEESSSRRTSSRPYSTRILCYEIVSLLISQRENDSLPPLSSRGPDRTDVGRPTLGQRPITDIDGESASFKTLTTVPGVITYQTEFIDVGVLAHVLGQVPVGHPRVYKRERRGVGAQPEETGHIWMLQSLPHDRVGTQFL
jgi:hypothetical protein